MDTRNKLSIWSDAAVRMLMANTLARSLPLYIVTEYPKSGGSWVAQMLSGYLELPFPRNRLPPLRSAVHHAHYLRNPFLTNTLVVMRDGRDIMVSLYFHMLFENDRSSPLIVKKTRAALRFSDYADAKHNLPKFIEYVFDQESKSLSPFHFTWPQFVHSWFGRDAAIVKYEELVSSPVETMTNALLSLIGGPVDSARMNSIVEKYSFSVQAKRSPGDEVRGSFLRKGTPGDWKQKFSKEAGQIFDQLAGRELVLLDYEKNNTWINRL